MEFYTVKDRTKELNELYERGFEKGTEIGWTPVDKILTLKKGYPWFVAGAPHSGKSEFILEAMVLLSLNKKWKWFIYMGESGSVAELIAEICYKIIGKPYAKREIHGKVISMSQAEKTYAEQVVSEYFYILDTEEMDSSVKDFKVNQFYDIVNRTEQQLGVKFDGTLIDPWNDVINETQDYGNREDLWLADALKVTRRDAKVKNRLNIIINHISDIKPIIDRETNRRYYPAALPSEWAGGRTWWRRAYLMTLIYRPPVFLNDENGIPHAENVSHIIVQKAKPKGIATLGTAKLYWDWKTNRYYEDKEMTVTPFDKKQKQVKPNIDFDTLYDEDNTPF